VTVVAMEQRGELSATQAKTVLGDLLESGGDPAAIVAARGFERLDQDDLTTTISTLIAEHPEEWTRYRDGDDKLAQFFVGLVMAATRGRANGKEVMAVLASRR